MTDASANPLVFLVATDLMMCSSVGGAARVAGAEFRSGDAVAAGATVTEHPQTLLLIDLGYAREEISNWANVFPQAALARAVAFGPHVHTQLLQLAREAGVGQVISRGQFSAGMGRIIQDYLDSLEA